MSERKVSTDALETLGMIHPHQQYRDAIHLAVEPVVAAERLNPGQHIRLEGGKAHAARGMLDGIGIVDPFLQSSVIKGQPFWLVIYPRKITSLRHVWSHPSLPEEAGAPVAQEDEMAPAKRRLAEIANECEGLDYDELMEAASAYLKYGEYLSHGPRFEGTSLPDDFWPLYEKVTGESVAEKDRYSFFSCSC